MIKIQQANIIKANKIRENIASGGYAIIFAVSQHLIDGKISFMPRKMEELLSLVKYNDPDIWWKKR